jgi:hypothetical protein
MLFRFPQLEDKFFTNILNSISHIQHFIPWKGLIYILISYIGTMPPANVVLYYLLDAHLFLQPHYLTATMIMTKEVRQNLTRLFYSQEMNLQKLFDLASVFSYHYNSTNTP